jgi:non-ribosomal peptide synthetase component E (peptide arylation enzyme)
LLGKPAKITGVPEEEKAIPFHPPEDVARYRAAGEWGVETLSDLVAANAAERADTPALIGDRGVLTWGRYDALGTELAGLLAGAGF